MTKLASNLFYCLLALSAVACVDDDLDTTNTTFIDAPFVVATPDAPQPVDAPPPACAESAPIARTLAIISFDTDPVCDENDDPVYAAEVFIDCPLADRGSDQVLELKLEAWDGDSWLAWDTKDIPFVCGSGENPFHQFLGVPRDTQLRLTMIVMLPGGTTVVRRLDDTGGCP